MGRKSDKRLTPAQMQAVRPFVSGMSLRAFAIAEKHLVHGVQQSVLADANKLSRNSVNQYVKAVWTAHLEHGFHPPGWKVISVCLPADQVDKVLEMQKTAQEEYLNSH